ncbi:ligase-associated DNA damage response endonuclease PdeM [Histidinibacterium lentulum]|uniref:Ligase-associated DNA damage response endonuclease PdeM n=1 Tax=Histidinibacterium lentulum TaxID=2480588 RepID=A0A3N2QUQ9_9RHOB|nr:ligase-associated DNA damage response endonuclease PdeM [Histidinibacterium lentulum]ROT98958.1 ligase-associated DNA damage response endonuclease PdeM [Histidinibacterium lentulum]
MNTLPLTLAGETLHLTGSGALIWPDRALVCVSDLHLGKSDRIARREGRMLPPYETRATLARLTDAVAGADARTVICLGDSFDDLAGQDALDDEDRDTITALQAGREWIWIEGNHDPGPLTLDGTHRAEVRLGALTFRHIAAEGASGEISGHYHPKCRLPGSGGGRPCFLANRDRLILPAFGAYTGGLACTDPVLQRLMPHPSVAVLTGPRPVAAPMPRGAVPAHGPPGSRARLPGMR